MTEPTLTDLYGDLAAATAKLVAVSVALDALDRVTDAIGLFDGAAYDALYLVANELTTHIEDLGGAVPAFLHSTLTGEAIPG